MSSIQFWENRVSGALDQGGNTTSLIAEILEDMKFAGCNRREMYMVLLSVYKNRDDTTSDNSSDEQELLGEFLDRLSGWCSPDRILFPHLPYDGMPF